MYYRSAYARVGSLSTMVPRKRRAVLRRDVRKRVPLRVGLARGDDGLDERHAAQCSFHSGYGPRRRAAVAAAAVRTHLRREVAVDVREGFKITLGMARR